MAARNALAALPEPPSLEMVFRQHAPFVLRMIRRMGAPAADVEDLAQQVFVVLQRRPELLANGVSPRSVLFGVMRRVVSGHRRRQRNTEPLDIEHHPREPEQEMEFERRRARAQLDKALDELDPARREVFALYEFEGLTMREVADLTGAPLQTAYSRLHSARATVRRALLGKEMP
jgi:RNA polymerase sigma-70 factor (ECF subfamily)